MQCILCVFISFFFWFLLTFPILKYIMMFLIYNHTLETSSEMQKKLPIFSRNKTENRFPWLFFSLVQCLAPYTPKSKRSSFKLFVISYCLYGNVKVYGSKSVYSYISQYSLKIYSRNLLIFRVTKKVENSTFWF